MRGKSTEKFRFKVSHPGIPRKSGGPGGPVGMRGGEAGRKADQGFGGEGYPRGWARGQRGAGGERPKAEKIRLVEGGIVISSHQRASDRGVNMGAAIQDALDPRWVLAVQVGLKLEGTILRRESRQGLILKGKKMGLNAFDANLIIAIVQDQARRGYQPQLCAQAGAAQLAMVPLPGKRRLGAPKFNGIKKLYTAIFIAVILLLELLLMKMWLGSQ